jgi:hypothetical protein
MDTRSSFIEYINVGDVDELKMLKLAEVSIGLAGSQSQLMAGALPQDELNSSNSTFLLPDRCWSESED